LANKESALRDQLQGIAAQGASQPSKKTAIKAPYGADRVLVEIEDLAGLQSVKEFANQLVARHRLMRIRRGLGVSSEFLAPHLVFTGDPGTGKTTVARLMGRLYKGLGMLNRGHVVEVGRGDLVGLYIGQTAAKTRAVCEKALGGVLFIDEAYSLLGSERDYGHEAVETLLTFMENNRGKLAVIIAGYPAETEKLLDSNAGLRSRFDKTLVFANFTKQELLNIFVNQMASHQYLITNSALLDVGHYLESQLSSERPPNARTVRQMVEVVINEHAMVLARTPKPNLQQACMITSMSIPRAWGNGREISVSEVADLDLRLEG
jgi:SpoVK/Ycf46/Vps4 family AAA+-type ATPase